MILLTSGNLDKYYYSTEKQAIFGALRQGASKGLTWLGQKVAPKVLPGAEQAAAKTVAPAAGAAEQVAKRAPWKWKRYAAGAAVPVVAANALWAPNDTRVLERAAIDRDRLLNPNSQYGFSDRLVASPFNTIGREVKDFFWGNYDSKDQQLKNVNDIIRAETQRLQRDGVRSGGNWLTNWSGYRNPKDAEDALNRVVSDYFKDTGLPYMAVDPRVRFSQPTFTANDQQDYINRMRMNLQTAANSNYYGG